MVVILILFGFLSGILGGMGMGGGTVLIPLLTIFLSFSQKTAQAFNLFSFLLMCIFALVIHFKNGLVEFKKVIPIILISLPFSFVGWYIATYIDEKILKIAFGVFLLLISLIEIVKLFKKNKINN